MVVVIWYTIHDTVTEVEEDRTVEGETEGLANRYTVTHETNVDRLIAC